MRNLTALIFIVLLSALAIQFLPIPIVKEVLIPLGLLAYFFYVANFVLGQTRKWGSMIFYFQGALLLFAVSGLPLGIGSAIVHLLAYVALILSFTQHQKFVNKRTYLGRNPLVMLLVALLFMGIFAVKVKGLVQLDLSLLIEAGLMFSLFAAINRQGRTETESGYKSVLMGMFLLVLGHFIFIISGTIDGSTTYASLRAGTPVLASVTTAIGLAAITHGMLEEMTNPNT